jgi:hypothetical protein
MGWHNCHMHAFIVGKKTYQSASAIEFNPFPNDDLPEDDYTLESLATRKGSKLQYCYDFGDNWMHEVVVENTSFSRPQDMPPVYCIEGVRACPPDDCGGVYGFDDFCMAMADPKHPEHEDLTEWFGGRFDPEFFDIAAVNKLFMRLQSSTPSKKVTKKSAKKTIKKITKKATKKVAKKAVKKAKKKKVQRVWVKRDGR